MTELPPSPPPHQQQQQEAQEHQHQQLLEQEENEEQQQQQEEEEEQSSPRSATSTGSSGGNHPYNEKELEGHFVQLIDENGVFTEKLPTYLADNHMTHLGLDYNIMSVFGPQSSGKSTLLNQMFGTRFDTMVSTMGRYQVTKGVCVSKSKQQDILIMDLEGTDSKERGEENTSFEKKISLFALSISEVLLVNMWMQDIGRYNASNFSLLKTVFELNLQLFHNSHENKKKSQNQNVDSGDNSDHSDDENGENVENVENVDGEKRQEAKTLLLFCIRDHHEDLSPLHILRKQLLVDIEKIWSGLVQQQYQNSKISDFFDLEFVALPHKFHQAKQFDEAVMQLRDRFINPHNDKYLFKPEYQKSVPIDGFQFYAEGNWRKIMENKDLDLPTQKEMLATFRCNEISNQLFVEFDARCDAWISSIKKRSAVHNMGVESSELAQQVLDKFHSQTHLYVQSVVQQKGQQLLERMKQCAHNVFGTQMLLVRENAVKFYQRLLREITKDNTLVLANFSHQIKEYKDRLYEFFEENAKKSIFVGEDWDYTIYREQLTTEVDRVTEECRKIQIRILMDDQKVILADSVKEGLVNLFKAPNKTFWKLMRDYFNSVCEEVNNNLKKDLRRFEATEEEIVSYSSLLKEHTRSLMKMYTDSYVNQLSLKINSRYDDKFKAHSGWKNLNEIQKVHENATQEALMLLDVFFLYRLTNMEYDQIHLTLPPLDKLTDSIEYPSMAQVIRVTLSQNKDKSTETADETKDEHERDSLIEAEFHSNVMLTREQCDRMYSEFIARVQNSVQNAMDRFSLLNNNKSIPYWMYFLLLALGWNEIRYFLTSPFWLFLIIVFGGIFGWAYFKAWISDYIENGENEIVKIVLRIVMQKVTELTQSQVGQVLNSQLSSIQQQIQQQTGNATSVQATSASTEQQKDIEMSEVPTQDTAPKDRKKVLLANSRSSVRYCEGVSIADLQSRIENEIGHGQ